MDYVREYRDKVENFSPKYKGEMRITRQAILNRINKNLPIPYVKEIKKSGNAYILVMEEGK